MQHAGMSLARRIFEGAFQHLHRLGRVGSFGRLSPVADPTAARACGSSGLGEERGHVQVVAEVTIDRPHGVGVVVVPDRAILDRLG